MKKLLIALCLLAGITANGQGLPAPPSGWTNIATTNYQWQGGRFNGQLAGPAGADTATAWISRAWRISGSQFTDTSGADQGHYVFYNGKWNLTSAGGVSSNIYIADGILTANRTLTGNNNTYGLTLDSLQNFTVNTSDGTTKGQFTVGPGQVFLYHEDADGSTTNLSVEPGQLVLSATNAVTSKQGLFTFSSDSISLVYTTPPRFNFITANTYPVFRRGASGTLFEYTGLFGASLVDSTVFRTVANSYTKAQVDASITLQRALTGSPLITDPAAVIQNDPSNTTGGLAITFGAGGAIKSTVSIQPNVMTNLVATNAGTALAGNVAVGTPANIFGTTSRNNQSYNWTLLGGSKYQYAGVDSNRAMLVADTAEAITRAFKIPRILAGIPGLAYSGSNGYIFEGGSNSGTPFSKPHVAIYVTSASGVDHIGAAIGTRNSAGASGFGIFLRDGAYQAAWDTAGGYVVGRNWGGNTFYHSPPASGLAVEGESELNGLIKYNALGVSPSNADSIIVRGSDGKLRTSVPWSGIGAGGGGTNNSNIGANYEWLKPAGQEIKSARKGLYLLIDSATANTLTFGVDTTTMFPQIRSTISAGAGSTAISALTLAGAANTIDNTNYQQTWQWSTLAAGKGLSLTSTSTAAASNTQGLFNVALSGANATSTQTTYAAQISNTHTGTSSTNYGLQVTAGSGTANYALLASAEATNIRFSNAAASTFQGSIGRDAGGGLTLQADAVALSLRSGASATAGINFTTASTTQPIDFAPNGVIQGRWLPAGLRLTAITTATTRDSVVFINNGVLESAPSVETGSGTYTATITNGTNVASSSFNAAKYIRTGSIVDVTLSFQVNATASATPTSLGISLPIASNFTATTDALGNGNENGGNLTTIVGDAANDRITVSYTSSTTASIGLTIHFKYSILP